MPLKGHEISKTGVSRSPRKILNSSVNKYSDTLDQLPLFELPPFPVSETGLEPQIVLKSPAEEVKDELSALLPEREQVQVYKDAFDLLLHVYRTTVSMNRIYRYTLAEDMKRMLTDMLTAIYEAKKDSAGRLKHIEQAQHCCYHSKVLFRLMLELRQVRLRQASVYIAKLASISKQLAAWQRYERRRSKQNENEAQPRSEPQ